MRWRRLSRPLGALALAAVALAVPNVAAAAPAGLVESGVASNTSTLSGALSVATVGQTAWVTAYYAGQLTAVDFSDPTAPTVVGSTPAVDSLKESTNVAIAGNYAYVVSKNKNLNATSNDDGTGNSLTVVDISNPASPTVVGSVHDSVNLFGGYGVAVSGSYVYVAAQGVVAGQPTGPDTGTGSFAVIDVSNPASPRVVTTLHNTALPPPYTGTNALDHATSVAISGNYAYVTASYANRLTVIDISNPLAPQIVNSIQDNTQLNFDVDVTVAGTHAYVADQGSNPAQNLAGLGVVDISNPHAPSVVGSLTSSWLNGAYRVRTRGNMAYVASNYAQAGVAVDISNPASPRRAAGLYDPTNLSSPSGVDVDSTGHYMLLTSPNRSSDPSGTNTGALTFLRLDPTAIAVSLSAMPASTTTQTTAGFSFAASDQVASLSCQLDGASPVPCASATAQSYSGLSPGNHTFQVTATDASGVSATSAPYSWTITGPPAIASAPLVSGQPVAGQVLTANPGSWTGYPAPSLTYQWLQCDSTGSACQAITGAVGASYTVAGADVGRTIAVQVTATNSSGQASATSPSTGVVTALKAVTTAASPPSNLSRPVISGQGAVGQLLRASAGTWSGSPAPALSYQWLVCNAVGSGCQPIVPATAATYSVARADVGATLKVLVTAANSAGEVSQSSLPTAVVRSPISSAQIVASLRAQVTPGGSLTKIPLLLRDGGYLARLQALEAGAAQVTWYYLPRGVSLTIARDKLVCKWTGRSHPRPVAIATARLTFTASGSRRLTIKLTAAGRRSLRQAKRLQLTAVGNFIAAGQSPVLVLRRFVVFRTAPRALD